MWSLAQWLTDLGRTDHLPSGFSARNGIRSLFPSGIGPVSITMLKSYLYAQAGTVSTSEVTGEYKIGADGSGRWFFEGVVTGIGAPAYDYQGEAVGNFGAGFVFMFSRDSTAHGYVLTYDGSDDLNEGQGFQIYGSDPWIAANWPDIFAKAIGSYISHADGYAGLPPATNAATDHGFTGLSTLEGAQVYIYDGPPWNDAETPPGVWETP